MDKCMTFFSNNIPNVSQQSKSNKLDRLLGRIYDSFWMSTKTLTNPAENYAFVYVCA